MNQVIRRDELQHYGTKGMKWGVINEDVVNAFNKFANNKELYKNLISSYKKIPSSYQHYMDDYLDPHNNYYWDEKDRKIKEKGVEQLSQYISDLHTFITSNGGISSLDGVDRIDGAENTMEQQANALAINDLDKETEYILSDLFNNPDKYSEEEAQTLFDKYSKYSMNCSNCAAVYELRRRGYDVEAMPYDKVFTLNMSSEFRDDHSNNYKGGLKWSEVSIKDKSKTEAATKELILKLTKSDQRGYIAVDGHIFNYEVKNGKVNWIDGQSPGLNSKMSSDILKRTSYVKVARTDDKEINDTIISRVRKRDDNNLKKKTIRNISTKVKGK